MTDRIQRKQPTGDPFVLADRWYETPPDMRISNRGKCDGFVILDTGRASYTARCDGDHPHKEHVKVQRFADGHCTRTIEDIAQDYTTATAMAQALGRQGWKVTTNDLAAWARDHGLEAKPRETFPQYRNRCLLFMARKAPNNEAAQTIIRVLGHSSGKARPAAPAMQSVPSLSDAEFTKRINALKEQARVVLG